MRASVACALRLQEHTHTHPLECWVGVQLDAHVIPEWLRCFPCCVLRRSSMHHQLRVRNEVRRNSTGQMELVIKEFMHDCVCSLCKQSHKNQDEVIIPVQRRRIVLLTLCLCFGDLGELGELEQEKKV